jgi:5-methylthioribose kinase
MIQRQIAMFANAPKPFHLDLKNAPALRAYLLRRELAEVGDDVTLELAGAGNMNCVVRVRLANRSFILKQARPWVEKYPSIAAPVERAASEAGFYRLAGQNPDLAAMMPRLLDFDEEAALLILEDLAPATGLEGCYAGEARLDRGELTELARYTSALHGLTVPAHERPHFRNDAMRHLNHEHIFDVPLRTDGALSEMLERITPGLDEAGETLRRDRRFCEAVYALGLRYLECQGPSLIHGDLFPGSLLRAGDGTLRVIDPEFSFCGDPEFDIGVFYAHLLLSGHDDEMASFWLQAALEGKPHSRSLALQYAGVEIMRRILGVAQLPIARSLAAKRELLDRSLILADP